MCVQKNVRGARGRGGLVFSEIFQVLQEVLSGVAMKHAGFVTCAACAALAVRRATRTEDQARRANWTGDDNDDDGAPQKSISACAFSHSARSAQQRRRFMLCAESTPLIATREYVDVWTASRLLEDCCFSAESMTSALGMLGMRY